VKIVGEVISLKVGLIFRQGNKPTNKPEMKYV